MFRPIPHDDQDSFVLCGEPQRSNRRTVQAWGVDEHYVHLLLLIHEDQIPFELFRVLLLKVHEARSRQTDFFTLIHHALH